LSFRRARRSDDRGARDSGSGKKAEIHFTISSEYIRCDTMLTVDSAIEFDWDEDNTKHLAAHKVTPVEFEQALTADPLDLDYESINGEERYRSVGPTKRGRLLSVVWTVRNGKVRAVTAFPASISDTQAFFERSQ